MQVPSKNSECNLIRIMFLLWGTQICVERIRARLRNNENTLTRWEPWASELDPSPPTSTFNPRETPRSMVGCGTRIIGHKLVQSDYFNLAVLMGPGGRQNNLDKTHWSATDAVRSQSGGLSGPIDCLYRSVS